MAVARLDAYRTDEQRAEEHERFAVICESQAGMMALPAARRSAYRNQAEAHRRVATKIRAGLA